MIPMVACLDGRRKTLVRNNNLPPGRPASYRFLRRVCSLPLDSTPWQLGPSTFAQWHGSDHFFVNFDLPITSLMCLDLEVIEGFVGSCHNFRIFRELEYPSIKSAPSLDAIRSFIVSRRVKREGCTEYTRRLYSQQGIFASADVVLDI